MRAPQMVLLVLLLLAAFQVWHYLPLLPERVASHFNGQGNADGFAAKADFAKTEIVVFAIMVALFLLLPKLTRLFPVSMINLPNKDYWLAEERREETLNALEDWMGWFGVLTLALLLAIMELAILANLSPKPRFDSAMATGLLVVYAGGALFMMGLMLWRFRRPV
jgi:uncharacterized membrane protein